MAVHTQSPDRIVTGKVFLPGPEKGLLRIVHQVAVAAQTGLRWGLVFDVSGVRSRLGQIMFGIGNIKFVTVAFTADCR